MNDLVLRDGRNLTYRDYEDIADVFDIPIIDAKDLVKLINSSFDGSGHFLRGAFEKNIPIFAWYGEQIFEFMWFFFKEKKFSRKDRISFLNSLQLLIERLNQPKSGIRLLLSDLLMNPGQVEYSDRNAIMLSNLLVRKYSKELNLDIEHTPEEVLLVKEGLDKGISKAVAEVIDAIYRKRISNKIRTIHSKLLQALDPGRNAENPMPLRYLLSLEREVFIFLCLIEGRIAHSVIRSALVRYGNPNSEIYMLKDSRRNLVKLLLHLKLLIRGISRFGTSEDLALLTQVSWAEDGFARLTDGTPHGNTVKQVMKWVDISKNVISKKDWP